MGIPRVSRTVSFLVNGFVKMELLMRKNGGRFWRSLAILGVCALIHGRCYAFFAQITTSTGAPSGVGDSFIASTQNQYQAKVTPNPLVSDVYSVVLYGPNPNYNPPVTNADLLNAIVTVDSYTYVYGWVAGQQYERQNDVQIISSHYFECDTDTTCIHAITGAMGDVYTQNFSTPTAVPGF